MALQLSGQMAVVSGIKTGSCTDSMGRQLSSQMADMRGISTAKNSLKLNGGEQALATMCVGVGQGSALALARA